MMGIWATVAVIAGAAVALQGAANSGLASRAGLTNALLVNATIVFAGSLVLWMAWGKPSSFLPSGASWTLYSGGLFGLVIVLAAAVVFPKTGGASAVAFIVLGQGLAAIAIDHWGLLGMPRVAITWPRMAGLALVCTGAALLRT